MGYVYSPRVLAHDPPPPAVRIAGRDFTLGSANVAQAALTAQAHDLIAHVTPAALIPGSLAAGSQGLERALGRSRPGGGGGQLWRLLGGRLL